MLKMRDALDCERDQARVAAAAAAAVGGRAAACAVRGSTAVCSTRSNTQHVHPPVHNQPTSTPQTNQTPPTQPDREPQGCLTNSLLSQVALPGRVVVQPDLRLWPDHLQAVLQPHALELVDPDAVVVGPDP